MEFRIADTFTASLARLTAEEQKAVKLTAYDLQTQPDTPSLQWHRIDRSKDARFWSARVSRDLRVIVHRSSAGKNESLLLCYADHHDAAYRWAERRRLEVHPRTGAAQLVEVRERVEEVVVPSYVLVAGEETRPAPRVFANISDGELLAYGTPQEWLADVREATEDSLLDLVAHLPAEAAEALLNLAVGIRPPRPEAALEGVSPFEHPDALRRFRVMRNVEELAAALDAPSERWAVFLHPAQRALVERSYNGPAKVAGSAGTGKTIVALHRAVFLARTHEGARVLLTTFSEPLSHALDARLRLLLGSVPRLAERVEVCSMDAVAARLYKANFGPLRIAPEAVVDTLLREAAAAVAGHSFSERFLKAEWTQVVDGWQLDTWESYRDVTRLGRRTRLKEAQRATLWAVFEQVRAGLKAQGMLTQSGLFNTLAAHYKGRAQSPFDFAVVDEAQDVSVAQLRFLSALTGGRENGLFFAGDLGQRIFRQPFSWKAAGVDVRGRSTTLKINYRTSHQIRSHSDRLLGAEVVDVDGNAEERSGTISVFNGPRPVLRVLASEEQERQTVTAWLRQQRKSDQKPGDLAVFVRSPAEIGRAAAAVTAAELPVNILDEQVAIRPDKVSIGTMHLAKGLEFRSVAVMACDEDILPQQARMEAAADEAELEEVYNTERHLLYVACTRARDRLLVTGVEAASEFLDDLLAAGSR